MLIGSALIVAHMAFRGWMLFPSWFYLDDFHMIHDAQNVSLSVDYLLTPWNGHLMPGGRLIIWVVAHSGFVNWPIAAAIMLVLQALSVVAAFWMFITIFGAVPRVLLLLALFLSTSLTVPSFMWWAAAINAVPLMLAQSVAIGCWVNHLRTGSRRWLASAMGACVLGLFFWEKAALTLPVLLFISMAWFTVGGLRRRIRMLFQQPLWPSTVSLLLIGIGYVITYLTRGSTDSAGFGIPEKGPGALADAMLGRAYASGMLGGPWRLSTLAPPNSLADPPEWLTRVTWVVIAASIGYLALRRVRTGRAWLLLSCYLLALLSLLYFSRSQGYGAIIGLEFRYVADASLIGFLALGLASMDFRGAMQSSAPRATPYLTGRLPVWLTSLAVAMIVGGGTASSVLYAQVWHNQNAMSPYLQAARADLQRYAPVDLADQTLPDSIFPGIGAPANKTEFLLPVLGDGASFPSTTSRLAVLGPDGRLAQALIKPGVVSEEGPEPDCGWRISDEGAEIPLTGMAFEWNWWVRIGYLYSTESPITVSAGDATVRSSIQPGVNSLYVNVDGTFDTIHIDGLKPGTVLCIDTVEVGQPEPGAPW